MGSDPVNLICFNVQVFFLGGDTASDLGISCFVGIEFKTEGVTLASNKV